MQKAVKTKKKVDLKLSQTQIENTAQHGGNLFSAMLGLARPLIKPAFGALASAGLGFGAEKCQRKYLVMVMVDKKLNFTTSSKQ